MTGELAFSKDLLKIAFAISIFISGCNFFGDDDNKFKMDGRCDYTPLTQEVQSKENLYGSWTMTYSTNPAWTDGCEKTENVQGFRLIFLDNGIVETHRNTGSKWESEYTTDLISGCGYLSFTSSIDSLIVDSSPCDGGKLLYLRDSQ